MFDLPHFAQFIPAGCIAMIGTLLLYHVLGATRGERLLLEDLPDNAVRAVASAFGLVSLWVGFRLAHSVSIPERWYSLTEMGWVVLASTAIGSTIFVRRSALAKWLLGLSIVGLAAMAYAVADYVEQAPHG